VSGADIDSARFARADKRIRTFALRAYLKPDRIDEAIAAKFRYRLNTEPLNEGQ
jgi:hypothetical protein